MIGLDVCLFFGSHFNLSFGAGSFRLGLSHFTLQMKVVSVKFPDGSHGKFSANVGNSLEALFKKACRKRELVQEEHNLLVDGEKVDDLDIATASVAGKALEVRKKTGVLAKARRIGKRISHQVMPSERVADSVHVDCRFCKFCGTTLYDEDLVTTFGMAVYHSQCFKCSHCFDLVSTNTKVYANEHDTNSPVCETCFAVYKGEKNCVRCKESIRGCFVLPIDRLGDMHVECLTCNLCNVSLVGAGTSYFEKDEQLLCEKHRHLKPQAGDFARPRKVGKWRSGEMCLLRIRDEIWTQGTIRRILQGDRSAEVEAEGDKYRIELADLRVIYMPVSVKAAQRDLRRGRRMDEVAAVQRQNSLATFVTVKSSETQKSPIQKKELPTKVTSSMTRPEIEAIQEPIVEKQWTTLRFADNEDIIGFIEGEWFPGKVVAGDIESGENFYLIAFDDVALEELLHESQIRRPPFFTLYQNVEACFPENLEWYAAVIEENINSNTYLVRFSEFGDMQQCSVDWIRAVEDACSVCGGPPEYEEGICYFCGGVEPMNPSFEEQKPLSRNSFSASSSGAEVAALHAEIERLQSCVLELSLENSELKEALESKEPVIDLTKSGGISVGDSKVEELRERLNEADARAAQAEAEVESLRKSNARNRLKQSAKKAQTNPQPLRRKPKPLPTAPSLGGRQASIAVQVGAGRGGRKKM